MKLLIKLPKTVNLRSNVQILFPIVIICKGNRKKKGYIAARQKKQINYMLF